MQLAPIAKLTASHSHIANGLSGIFQTIAIMRDMVSDGRTSPIIRDAAASIAFLTPEKNEMAEVVAVFEFVRDNVRYLKDIHEVETLTTPEKTLQCRYGDCDDQSVLLASMLEAIGYMTRFVCAGYSDPDCVEHVYVQVAIGPDWISCDPTERQVFGYEPPYPACVYVENLS